MNMWKVYPNDDNDNDDGQRTNFDQKSSLEPSAQVSVQGLYMYNLDQDLFSNELPPNGFLTAFSAHVGLLCTTQF